MPPTTTQDAHVAALLRRALPQERQSSELTAQALLGISTTTSANGPTTTFTHQQQLLQEMYDFKVAHHVESSALPTERDTEREDTGSLPVEATIDVERRISELYELREAQGDGHACCYSSAERDYVSCLQHEIVKLLARDVCASEPHRSSGTAKDACRALLTLCVKPTALAREIAFSLMHDVAMHATLLSVDTHQPVRDNVQLQNELFACVADMLVKSVAVASTQDATCDSAWMVPATACLVLFVRSSSGRYQYRTDHLHRLDVSALVFLARRVFSFTTAACREAELQDTILEMLVAAMYTHGTRAHGATAGMIAMADVERFGGVDLLLAVFYSTASDRTRRLVLGVVFDLAVDQVKRSKALADDKAAWASYDGLLCCLHECAFASLVAASPLTFVDNAATVARRVKILHAATENELLQSHVGVVWSTLRTMLQIDECFVHSASLAHALKLASSATQQSHESIAEVIVAKAQQLIVSPRPDERFKGERWLAELLVHGLQGDSGTNNNASQGSFPPQHLLGECDPKPTTGGGDQLEESLCYDEAADIRLTARAKLWELSRSPSLASRLTFARVLALFTKRRVRIGAPSTVVSSHLTELNPCLDALVVQGEDSPAVLLSLLDTLLHLVVISHEVPYLDVQRQRYDHESSDAPQELVGALVASESLAGKLLRGKVGVDRTHVAEISLTFMLHALDVLDTALATESPPTLASDVAVAAALLVSYALEDAPIARDTRASFAPYLDSPDPRIAVIAARSITTQLKRDVGHQRYADIVRQAHAVATESDDEAPLANSVAHAHMLLRELSVTQLTP